LTRESSHLTGRWKVMQRAKEAMELIRGYDLVYVHFKGLDEPGHDGDFDGKKGAVHRCGFLL